MESLSVDGNGNFPIGGARAYGPLPSGRHALPEEVVAAQQRARLEVAMLEVVGEIGYPETAVKDILERAGTSRRVFYSHYESKARCFLAAYETATKQLEGMAVSAAGAGGSWRARLRAALAALLGFLDEEPRIGRALIVEVHAAGPEGLQARAEAMRRVATALEEMRSVHSNGASAQSPVTSEGVLGGIEQSLRIRLREEEPGAFAALLPELMYFAVLSYLGPAAATEELAAVKG